MMDPTKLTLGVTIIAILLSVAGNFMVIYLWDLAGGKIKDIRNIKHLWGVISTILFVVFALHLYALFSSIP